MAELATRSEKRGRSLRRTLSGRFRRSKPKAEAATSAELQPDADSPSAPVATRRSGRRFMSSIRRKAKSEGTGTTPAVPTSQTIRADVERLGEQGDRVVWSLDKGHSTVSLIDVHLNEIGSLELEAFRSYALVKLHEQLPSTEDWSDPNLTRRESEKNSSINSFLKKLRSRGELFGGSASFSSYDGSPRSPTAPDDGCMFGLSLEKVVSADRRRLQDSTLEIPRIVYILINRLLTDGLQTHGIFRINGNSRRVHQLAETFDSGVEPELATVAASDIASLLKMFLRQLPEPVLTWQLYAAFVQVPGLPESRRLAALQHLCIMLPETNRHVLQALLQLLVEIAKHADGPGGNEMNIHNLAVVMAPNVLRPDTKSGKQKPFQPSEGANLGQDDISVLELMIQMHEDMFMVSRWHRDGMLRYHYSTSPQLVYTLTKGLVLRKNSLRPPTPPDSLPSLSDMGTPSLIRPKSAPGRSRHQGSTAPELPQKTGPSLGPRVSIAISEFSNQSDAAIDLGPLLSRDTPPPALAQYISPQRALHLARPSEALSDDILCQLGHSWNLGTDQARQALSQSYAINPAPFSSATLTTVASPDQPRQKRPSVTTIDPPSPLPSLPGQSASSSFVDGADENLRQAFRPHRRSSNFSTKIDLEAATRQSPADEDSVPMPSIEALARRQSRKRSSIRRKSGGGSSSPRTRRQSHESARLGRDSLASTGRTDSDVGYIDLDDDRGTFV